MRVTLRDEKSREEGVLECVCCGVEFGCGQRQIRGGRARRITLVEGRVYDEGELERTY